jgi:hypothetical protein
MVPAHPDGTLETALNRALEDILGQNADVVRSAVKAGDRRNSWAVMPTAEAVMLSVRENLPEKPDQIIQRTRHHYQLLVA